MLDLASAALQTSDVPTLSRLCEEAQKYQTDGMTPSPAEAASLEIPLQTFSRQVHLAGNNVRLRQVLLQGKTERRSRWAP